MLDTIGIGVQVTGLDMPQLLDRGWQVWSKTTQQEKELWACCQYGGVRIGYLAGIGWLSAESSLPPLLGKKNSELLSPVECGEAIGLLHALVGSAVGRPVPTLGDWKVSRFDPVWAWDRDPAPYIGALSVARLPRTHPVRYETGVRWVTRAGKVRARAYDKAAEQHEPVGLPLRVERQVRSREKVRVQGRVIGRAIDDVVSEPVCLGIVRDALSGLGLDRPIPSLQATRGRLLEMYGTRAGRGAWAVLRDLLDCGGVWPADVSRWSKLKYERLWRAAGVSAVSPVGLLPALTV